MKKITFVVVCLFVISISDKANAQATSSKNTTDKNGKQCSSVGYGKDKAQAEKNREQSEKAARESGHESHSGKDGGGAGGCHETHEHEAHEHATHESNK